MSVYLDAVTRLDRRSAEAAMAEAKTMWRTTSDDIGRGLSGAINRALGAIDGSNARRTLQELRTEHQRLASDAAEAQRIMERSVGNVETRTRALAEVTQKYGADSSRASAATVALADAHAVAARNTRLHEQAATDAAAAHTAMSAATEKTATSMGAMAAVANGVGVASIVGLGTAMAVTTKAAGDFQASQTRLVASAGESAQNLQTVSDGILKMAGDVGYSAQQLSTAMYDVEKAGYRGADGVTVLKAAAQGAKSENADLGEVLNGLTTSLHDFNMGAGQASDMMSKLVVASGLSKSNFQEFTGALHSAEPIIASIGKSQGLTADQMSHLNADLLGLGAQMTQTGMSSAQSFELIGHAAQKLLGPTAGMRSMMGALGLDAEQVTDHLGERGLAGTLQDLQQALQAHTKNGKVNLDVHYQSAQAARAEAEAFNALPGPAKAVAEQIKNNTLSYAEWRKSRGGVDREMANELGQWDALNSKLTGFSDLIKSGIGDQISADQAWKILVGDQETLQVALQATGENADGLNNNIKKIGDTTRETDGTVKGFNETSETLNAKMDKAKAAFGAAGIEIGTMFVPVMTEVANVAKSVGDFMAEHPGLAHAAADAMIGLAGAWTVWKIASSDAVKAVVSGFATVMEKLGLTTTAAEATNTALAAAGPAAARGAEGVSAAANTEIAEENAVADAAGRADAAMAGGAGAGARGLLGPAAAVAGVDMAAHQTPEGSPLRSIVSTALPFDPTLKPDQGPNAPWYKRDALTDIWHWLTKPEGHAGGGPVAGPGPKGRDSVRAWLAPGEHVLTAADVDAAGGHAGVYAWRNALHREMGGPSDIDAAILSNVPIGRYSNTGAADLTKGLADCSSAVEGLVHIMDGEAIPAMRQMSTGNEAQWLTAHGFLPGMGGPGDFRVGFNDHHTQATLPGGTPFNWGSDAAAARGGVGGTGADDPAFTSHFYRPVSGVGGEQRLFVAQERVHKLEDRIAVLQQKISEETSKTKESEKIRLDDELKRAQEELAHAKDQLAEVERSPGGSWGYGRGRGGAGGMQFGAPLPENMGLGKGIPGFFEWLATFAADMAIGPIEGAMLGNYLRSGGEMGDSAGGFGDVASAMGVPLTGLDSSLGGNYSPPAGGSDGGSGAGGGGGASSGGSGGSGGSGAGARSLWWTPGTTPLALTDMSAQLPAAPGPGGPGRFIGPVSQSDLAQGALMSGLLGTAPGYGWRNPGNPVLDLLNPSRDPSGIGGAPFGALASPGGGINLGGLAASAAASKNMYQQFYGYGKHFATGGPSGKDTIPAWLAPGEFVMNSQATKDNLMALQMMNAGHYDTGTQNPLQPGAGQGQPASKPGGAQPPKPMPQQGKPGPGQEHLTGSLNPGPGNEKILGSSDVHPGVATPGADTQQFGEGLPASSGIGFGGGLIGAAEQAAAGAASAAGAAGGGGGAAAGMAMNMAFQMMNRTAGYIGQLGGIAAEGVLSTLLPADSPLSNFSNTLPGKLIAGIAGVRPGQPNSAGKTESPLKTKGLEDQSRDGGGTQGGGAYGGGGDQIGSQTNFHGPITVKANNPQEFQQQMSREYSGARAAYPTNLP